MADDSRRVSYLPPAARPWSGGYPDLCPEECVVTDAEAYLAHQDLPAVTLVCVLTAGHVPPHWDAVQRIWWHDPAAEPGEADQPGAGHGGPSA